LLNGNDFYIKIKYFTPGYNTPIPVESVLPGYSSNAVIQSGVGWVSSNGTSWTPIGNNTSLQYDLCIRAYAANEPVAPIISASSVTGCPGSQVTIPVTVNGFTNITSMSARMDYDATMLSYISFTNANNCADRLDSIGCSLDRQLHKLVLKWQGTAPQSITAGGKSQICIFLTSQEIQSFPLTTMMIYGWDCQFTDALRSPLFDNPSTTYFHNSQVTYAVIQPTITGQTQVCYGSGYQTYSTEPGMSNYAWSVSAGGTIISGSDTNFIQVNWNATGTQSVYVNYVSPLGCSPPQPASFGR